MKYEIEVPPREVDTSPESEYGVIYSNRFRPNPNQQKRIWVVDDFYEDPDAVREWALQQTYYPSQGSVGWRTKKQFHFDGVKERIADIMDHKITKWEEWEICGRFQAGFADDKTPLVYHCDTQKWAAMVYLTPNAPFETGTKIVANKKTKIYHSSQSDNVLDFFPQQETFCDGTLFETVDVVGNVYNRLVIFDGQSLHSACGYFGHNIATGRLWQIFFFDAEPNKK